MDFRAGCGRGRWRLRRARPELRVRRGRVLICTYLGTTGFHNTARKAMSIVVVQCGNCTSLHSNGPTYAMCHERSTAYFTSILDMHPYFFPREA